jgi:hypothetical protein
VARIEAIFTGKDQPTPRSTNPGRLGYVSVALANKIRRESTDHLEPFDRRNIKGMTVSS